MRKMIVKKYKTPSYPRFEEFNSIGLRTAALPSRWKNRFAAGLLTTGAFAAMMSGCVDNFRTAGIPLAPESLTEQVAIYLIQSEFDKHSIQFKESTEASDLIVPANAWVGDSSEASLEQVPYKVVLDGLDADKNIGFEYLTSDDYLEWNKQNENNLIRMEMPSETLFSDSDGLKVGIFHESYSEEDLKDQITSFLEWLKTQGVI
ncbi:MAG: hypothetical protein GX115_07085 [Ruminiclostridium sp.]|nr:hypothetical protein [Ruminiclostridium sp.]